MKIGPTEKYLWSEIESKGSIHLSLLDPEEFQDREKLIETVSIAEEAGTSGFMIGGSTVFDQSLVDRVVVMIKDVTSLPVILFPNDITGLSRHADALWFMSLLNSINPYFITGVQMRAAFLVKAMGLEAIPMAYLIVGEGKTAGYMGYAHNIPLDEPKIAAAYALAASYMGFRFVYLEAGSGAGNRVDTRVISIIKKAVDDIGLVVGGGIKTYEDAFDVASSGADIIVTGNILEVDPKRLFEIVRGVREGGKEKLRTLHRKAQD